MRLAVIMTWVATCAMGATLQRPQVPYTFEENRGQAPEPVKFLARGQGYSLFLTEREAVLSLKRDARTQQVIRMSLDGARSPQSIAGSSPTGQTSNYFVGQREQWKTGVLHFESVRYSQVYPGVDMIYHSAANQLEYDFAVDAGASPNAIQLNFSGVEDLRVTPAGALELRFGNRKLVHQAPFAYQEIDGKRRRVAVAYQLRGDHSAGFRVGKYDLSRQLVIDPVVLYSTYLGGDRSDTVNAIAVDSAGNTYVTGQTTSTNFPKVGAGIFNPTSAVFYSFITKYNAAGTAILYSTYMGGSSNTTGYAIAADKDGNAFLAGVTGARDFPLVNPVQTTQPGLNIGYVAKLNPAGNALLFSTYIGGERNDEIRGLALDRDGNIHVAGRATSTTFPTVNAVQSTFGGSQDAFVAVYSAPNYRLRFSTYLGGAGNEDARAVAVDSSGRTYVTGAAGSPGLATAGAYQTLPKSRSNAFVARFNEAGSKIDWFTYYGGRDDDVASAVAIDTAGNVLIGGSTYSDNLPMTARAIQAAKKGDTDAFLVRLSGTGSDLLSATYLGSSNSGSGVLESVNSIGVDANGGVNITGITTGGDFPTLRAFQPYGGKSDAFVARLAPDLSSFVYSSHLGGTDVDTGFGLAVDVNGGVHVGGDTLSADFPMKNAVRTTFSGAREAFVSNICDPILIASTTNLFFQYEVGKAVPAAQTLQISACAPIAFQVQAVGDFIRATPVNGVTNGTISVAVDPKNLQPGTYQGQVRITATDAVNSPLSFSVVFKVTGPPPVISAAGVAHGAAAQAGAVAPGELIVIYGQNMGPQGLGGAELDGLGRVSTTIQDTRVYFDGVAAPMVYTSSGQISTIVPYAVAGHAVTNIEVEFQGVRSNKISVPVTATAPGIFTQNQTGTGPGAILNADYSPNGPNNPIARGGIVAIYATGEGQTDPAGIDGTVAGNPLPKPLAPVKVTVGGVEVQLLYAGAAPGLVAGVLQVNIVIPQAVAPGVAEVLLKIGDATSRAGVTVAVK